jgi:glyoxylase-like metal-dependent hydrolase (beta-lactamase superfamily II)
MATALTYPFSTEPGLGDGSVVEVTPGVLWLRMPLPGPLKWINVWALAEQDGWCIVDTGLHVESTLNAWQAAFQGALGNKPVRRVVVTHMHPDHCGMAGWMVQRFDVPLWMTRLEYLTCRVMAADTGREAPKEALAFFRGAGWDEEALANYQQRFGFFGKAISPLPASFQRLSNDDVVRIGEHEWKVVVGMGHSPEHACLYCKDLRLFISGDQVLPRITSNVSVFPTEPNANPLNDWLESLAAIPGRVPNDVLVLPAHNLPFIGLHERIGELIESHRRGLSRLAELIAEPKRVIDVFPALFNRAITPELLGMATGEALAHLNYLLQGLRASRELDAAGVWWWRASTRRAPDPPVAARTSTA